MHKRIIIGVASLALVGGLSSAYLVKADKLETGSARHYYLAGKHEAIFKALNNNDYAAWKELMKGRPVADVINESNFPRFVEMHNLIREGRYAEANQIRTELGLKERRKNGRGMHQGQNRGGNFVDQNGDGNCDRMDR